MTTREKENVMVIHKAHEVPKIIERGNKTMESTTFTTLAKRSKRFMRAPRAPPRLPPWDRSKCKDFNLIICKVCPVGKTIISCKRN